MEMPNHGSGHSMAMGHNNAWQNGQINRLGWFNEYQRHWGSNKITASYRLDYSHATANDPSHYFMMKYGIICRLIKQLIASVFLITEC